VILSGDKRDFNSILITAVDRALSESMGQSVSGAIKACIPIQTITTDPKGFALKLEKMTGGTKVVEQRIMRNLEIMISERNSRPLGSFQSQQMDFGGFIENCRGQFKP
jgi:hypothetical protein